MRIVLVRQTKPYQLNMVAPLGLLSLASLLNSRFPGRHQIFILDNRLERWPIERLAAETLKQQPDLLGATAMTHEVPETIEFLDLVSKRAPGLTRVVGGVHVSADPGLFLERALADYAVLGEGETTFAELVEALETGRDPRGMAGLAWCDNGELRRGPQRAPIEDIDELPPLDYGLIELSRYFGWPSGDNLFYRPEHAGYVSSRGCPFRCGYCHNMFGRRFRPHSTARVLDDLERLVRTHDVREVHFWDDVFNLDKRRTIAICDGIVERGLDIVIAFPNGLRIETMDEQMIDALIRAGMRRLSYGIESGDQRTLKALQRYGDLDKIREIVRATVERGVLTKGLFILGAPGETAEGMENTVRFALEVPLHYATFHHFIAMPSAPLGQQLLGRLERPPTWDDFNYECSDLNVSAVPAKQLVRTIRRANRRFYLRPRTIFNLLRLLPWRATLVLIYITAAWGYIFSVRGGSSRGMWLIRFIWSRTKRS